MHHRSVELIDKAPRLSSSQAREKNSVGRVGALSVLNSARWSHHTIVDRHIQHMIRHTNTRTSSRSWPIKTDTTVARWTPKLQTFLRSLQLTTDNLNWNDCHFQHKQTSAATLPHNDIAVWFQQMQQCSIKGRLTSQEQMSLNLCCGSSKLTSKTI